MLGESGVGKQSLLKKSTDDMFEKDYVMTLGVDFHIKHIKYLKTGAVQELTFQIWDVRQTSFTHGKSQYLKKAQGAFLIFDLTRLDETFSKLDMWLDDVQKQSPSARIIVFGNKEDITKGLIENKFPLDLRLLENMGKKVGMNDIIPFGPHTPFYLHGRNDNQPHTRTFFILKPLIRDNIK